MLEATTRLIGLSSKPSGAGPSHTVAVGVFGNLIHTLTHPAGRGQMKNQIDSFQPSLHRLAITHIANDEFDLVIEIIGAFGGRPVDLLRKVVECPNDVRRLSQEQAQSRVRILPYAAGRIFPRL